MKAESVFIEATTNQNSGRQMFVCLLGSSRNMRFYVEKRQPKRRPSPSKFAKITLAVVYLLSL